MYSTRWHYNGCNRIFACNFHILNITFAKLVSICSLDRAGFSDIGHFNLTICFLKIYPWKMHQFSQIFHFKLFSEHHFYIVEYTLVASCNDKIVNPYK